MKSQVPPEQSDVFAGFATLRKNSFCFIYCPPLRTMAGLIMSARLMGR